MNNNFRFDGVPFYKDEQAPKGSVYYFPQPTYDEFGNEFNPQGWTYPCFVGNLDLQEMQQKFANWDITHD